MVGSAIDKAIESGQKYGWGLILIYPDDLRTFLLHLASKFGRIRVLDVGAWKCHLYYWIKEKVGINFDYVGIDIVDLPDRFKEPEFYVMSPTYLLFPASSFHAVIMLETLEHIYDYTLALREAYRVLVPGGGIFIQSVICYDKCAILDETHMHVLHPVTLERLLRHIGFKDIKWKKNGTFCIWGFK